MVDNFPKGSVIRKVNIEPAILFGAGRALLLQLAHESVAQGVQDHSDFKGNPFKRLQGTLEATNAVVFGSKELADAVGRRIQWMHGFVRGAGYEANDPANLMWVHATLVDTALLCYQDLVGPLSAAEQETYYQEMKLVAEAFGCPTSAQPATLADFHRYFDDAVASLEVSALGRDLIGFILDPELPLNLHVPFKPLLGLQRRFTMGTLPPPVREQLGLAWSTADQVRFERGRSRVRAVVSRTPRSVRTAPNRLSMPLVLWQAQRHVDQWEKSQSEREARREVA